MCRVLIDFKLNGKEIRTFVSPTISLLQFLRQELHAYEVKNGCERGDCGACVVLLDGVLVNSCLVLAAQINGSEIVTIKGIGTPANLHPLQDAFVAHDAVQCGYCTPGMILAAKALLDDHPHPTEDEIRRALAGNVCRCTGYIKIVEAVKSAAGVMAAGNFGEAHSQKPENQE